MSTKMVINMWYHLAIVGKKAHAEVLDKFDI